MVREVCCSFNNLIIRSDIAYFPRYPETDYMWVAYANCS